MNDNILMTIGTVELFLGAAGALVFAVSYALFFRWRKTAAGRALLAFVVSLVLVFTLNIVGLMFGPDYPGREIVRIIIYSTVFVSPWYMVWVLWHSWHKSGKASLELKARNHWTNSNRVVQDPDTEE